MMKEILSGFLAGKSANDFLLNYHIGNAFRGETLLKMWGDGTYLLQSTVTKKRKLLSYKGHIDMAELKKIVHTFINEKIWETKHLNATPADDDALSTIEVSGNKKKAGVFLFTSEVEKVPSFNLPQKSLLQLIKKISSNEILEQGF